jgi:hypothetical protein
MIHVFGTLGDPPKQACPKSVLAGDPAAAAPLPGIKPPAEDAEKPAEIAPVEKSSWFKVGAIGLAAYAGLKVLGWL